MAEQKTVSREKMIVRTGVVGIIANVLLASFKALIGLAVHSTAMVLDAVNNFSDVMSSVVTIIGTKIASKLFWFKTFVHYRWIVSTAHLSSISGQSNCPLSRRYTAIPLYRYTEPW